MSAAPQQTTHLVVSKEMLTRVFEEWHSEWSSSPDQFMDPEEHMKSDDGAALGAEYVFSALEKAGSKDIQQVFTAIEGLLVRAKVGIIYAAADRQKAGFDYWKPFGAALCEVKSMLSNEYWFSKLCSPYPLSSDAQAACHLLPHHLNDLTFERAMEIARSSFNWVTDDLVADLNTGAAPQFIDSVAKANFAVVNDKHAPAGVDFNDGSALHDAPPVVVDRTIVPTSTPTQEGGAA